MRKFTPLQYLQIDIANNYGKDKDNWDDRLSWFDKNKDNLDDLIQEAEEPALFYAGVQAYRDAQAGIPSGYPISLDATSSGLQILAALTGDRSAAQLCNVVNTGHREDAYTLIYLYMVAKLGDTAKITRAKTKDAIMTSLYGSKAVPKEVFGEGVLLAMFYDTMRTLAPAAWELNEMFLALWDPEALSYDWVLPDNFHVHTKVMTTVSDTVHFLNEPFEVQHHVNLPISEGRSLGANTVHSIDGMIVREMVRRCNYDPEQIAEIHRLINGTSTNQKYKDKVWMKKQMEQAVILWEHYLQSGYLSARILDHITPDTIMLINPDQLDELLESLPAKPFQIMTIHDCFRCLPAYGNDLREQYTRQLYLIARSNMLSFLLSQLVGKYVAINKLDDTLAADILAADYALS